MGDGVRSAGTAERERRVENVKYAAAMGGINCGLVDLLSLAPFSLDRGIGQKHVL